MTQQPAPVSRQIKIDRALIKTQDFEPPRTYDGLLVGLDGDDQLFPLRAG